ncbi:MAG: polyphosphate kinase 2 [Paracoccaceae bacterium]
MPFDKPFDGAISKFYANEAPNDVREAIERADKNDMLNPAFPYARRLARKDYERDYAALQIELVKLQSWLRESGARLAVVFEGRDAAGKGGSIKRLTENLNPRYAHVVALPKPTEAEQGQWYFQRYISHMPTKGEIVAFDRSWYNRAVVEPVFGFCTDQQRDTFFEQVPAFEDLLVQDGIRLVKIWLTIGRAEQLRRILARESDPLKQWKLSSIDVKGLSLWEDYSAAISKMFALSHHEVAPWHVVRSDDKRRARLAIIRLVLGQFGYTGKDETLVGTPDAALVGPPEAMGFEGDGTA